MEPIYAIAISIAFIFGLAAKALKLPPLLGFLAAGFLLSSQGLQSGAFINTTADLGVTLLLFTIGLKLRVKDLLVREVWASASAHMLFVIGVESMRLPLRA